MAPQVFKRGEGPGNRTLFFCATEKQVPRATEEHEPHRTRKVRYISVTNDMRARAVLIVLLILGGSAPGCRSRESQTPTPSGSQPAAAPQIASKATAGK